jgi:hypothetical protein
VISAMNGTQIHCCGQATYSLAGKPRRPAAVSPYSKLTKSAAASSPAPARIQPTGWRGRRQVSSAPMPPKPSAHKPVNPRMPKNPAGVGVDQSQTSSARPIAAIASVRTHSDRANRRAHRIKPTSPSTAAGHPGRS